MKQSYICLNCGHTFTYNRNTADGRCCPDCNGPIVPCTIGIDLASGKDQTGYYNAKQGYQAMKDSGLEPPFRGSSAQ